MNQQHPESFRSHKFNPILTAVDWSYPVHTVILPRHAPTQWYDPTPVPLRESARKFSFLSGSFRKWRGEVFIIVFLYDDETDIRNKILRNFNEMEKLQS
ncbi:hypothetical protein JXQ31_15305 [candidate division KSB1 bacterium]|nr:hypothetical protein [candidate division KSB1 bacterium]